MGSVPEALDTLRIPAGLLALRGDCPVSSGPVHPTRHGSAQPRPAVGSFHRPAGQLLRRRNTQRATVAGGCPRVLASVAGPRARANCGSTWSPTSWQLPRTSSDAERVDYALRTAPTPADGLIAIYTGQAVFFQALARACRIAGYSSVWTTTRTWWSLEGTAAVLWHAWAPDDGEFEQLRQVAAQRTTGAGRGLVRLPAPRSRAACQRNAGRQPSCRSRFCFPTCGTRCGK